MASKPVVTITPIKFSTIPQGRRGFRSSGPMVGIRENGQIAFNSTLTKELGITGNAKVAVMFGSDRQLHFIVTDKAISKEMTAEDLATLSFSEKNKSCYLSGAGFLKDLGYDYKASGSQSFNGDNIKVDAKYKAGPHVALTLPEGALTPKPKTPRKKKDKGNTAAAAGTTAAATPAASEPAKEEAGELTFD